MEKQISVSRIFEAPVADVWKLWSDAEYVKQWWGPDHFICPLAHIHFHEGETSLVSMQAPDEFGGATHYSIWKYTRIVLHDHIEFIQNLATPEGIKVNPTAIGMPDDFPEDVRTLVTFKIINDNTTEMTVTEYADFGQMSHFAQLGLEQSVGKAMKVKI